MTINISNNVLTSVEAVLSSSGRRERTKEEQQFDQIVKGVKYLPKNPRQKPLNPNYKNFKRAYSVTTIAGSARYGTRTVVVCSTLKRARQIVEGNHGDIFETSYMLAVIEAIALDHLYCHMQESYWYAWKGTREVGNYSPIEVPKEYRDCFGFGVG